MLAYAIQSDEAALPQGMCQRNLAQRIFGVA